MDNRFFSQEMLDVLLYPEGWQLISSLAHPEVAPVRDARHLAWMDSHAHGHAHQEILLILRGEGHFGYRGQVYPCRPGTLFLFDAFEPHDLECPAWSPEMEHLWIILVEEHFVARLLPIRHGGYCWPGTWNYLLPREEAGLAGTRGFFALREEAGGLPADFIRLKLCSAVGMLVTALIRAGYAADHDDRHAFQQRVVAAIQQHIRETAGNGESLDSLARISGYSKFHFLRLFEQHTGQTVHHFLDDCRLQRVRAMLERGCSKKVISTTLGFSCQSAFSRWLKKWDV